jgi:cytochrome P450
VLAVHSLAHHPQYQERLRDEVLGLVSTTTDPAFADIESLSFLDNFLREVLRVHCPVAYIPREATQDVEVAGVLLPKGTVVNMCPAVINMHPRIWGEDAEVFNPDRWNKLSGDAASAYAFESFHNGPRMCIGKQLSMMEMKIIMMELVSRFRVEALDLGKPLELASPSFTLRPKERLQVRLTELSPSATMTTQ